MNDASSPESGNPGVTLREARLRRGLSQEQVTAETNISPRYVQALEEDDYSALPGQAFARGYLRRYAQLVQVDADVLVPAFDRLWLQQHPAPAAGLAAPAAARKAATSASRPARTGSLMDQGIEQVAGSVSRISLSRLLSVGSLALLALLLIGTLFWQGDDEPEVPRIDESMPLDIDAEMAGSASPQAQPQPELPPLVEPQPAAPVTDAATAVDAGAAPAAGMAPDASPAAPAATAVIPVAPPVAASAPRPVASQPPAATVIPVAPQPAATLAPVAAPATVKPATAPTAAPPAKPGATQPLTTPAATPSVDTLNFGFTGKSWISVRDATGQELVYGLKGEGQTVTVTGQAPFSINIGNVKVTTMTRNGKPVSLKPYTRGEIASFRLNK